MKFKNRKCVIINKMNNENLYLVLKEERGIVFDLIVSPSTYSQHNIGENVYFNLRPLIFLFLINLYICIVEISNNNLNFTTMNEMNFLFDDFDVESNMIEFNINPEVTFNDLTDAEKEEIFGEEWTMKDALELCNR